MSLVFVKRAAYDYPSLRTQLFEIMEQVGGRSIERGAHVVVKPNLLAPAAPQRAMLTHPMVVKGVVEYVLDRGGRVQLSDSPAMGNFQKVLKKSGILEALKGWDVTFKELKDAVAIDMGEPFRRVEVARDVLEADVLINLPKLKTHCQMLLTLGVKNLFGCIVGFEKQQWHLRTGVDREMFAALLVRIYQTVKPRFTILDGILAMEGEGPGKGGRPKDLGILMGSADAVALDRAVCRLLGLDEEALPTNKMAGKFGLLDGPVEISGDWGRIEEFDLPKMVSLIFGPKCSQAFLRKHLIQRPVVEESLCKSCGDCMRCCPVQAISLRGKKITFNFEKCVRCYCCLEVCPHGAVKTHQPLIGEVVARVMNRPF